MKAEIVVGREPEPHVWVHWNIDTTLNTVYITESAERPEGWDRCYVVPAFRIKVRGILVEDWERAAMEGRVYSV